MIKEKKDAGKSAECDEFLQILQDVERTSKPITFETLDLIAGNQEADKLVMELIGKEVDEKYRYEKQMQLEEFLLALQRLADYWKLI